MNNSSQKTSLAISSQFQKQRYPGADLGPPFKIMN